MYIEGYVPEKCSIFNRRDSTLQIKKTAYNRIHLYLINLNYIHSIFYLTVNEVTYWIDDDSGLDDEMMNVRFLMPFYPCRSLAGGTGYTLTIFNFLKKKIKIEKNEK
jgi:hypothetical protein